MALIRSHSERRSSNNNLRPTASVDRRVLMASRAMAGRPQSNGASLMPRHDAISTSIENLKEDVSNDIRVFKEIQFL